jgi:hypothetical protein
MSIDQTDWSKFLKPGSDLPPDILFNILENESEDDVKTANAKVSAHRLILAGVSPVFRKLFFGPMKNTETTLDMKDTTVEAFTTMINYIYMPSKSDQFSLSDITCPETLFEVLNLAERYEIPTLKIEVTSVIESLPITSENMMFMATVAKNYTVFDEASKLLMAKCGVFCGSQLKTSEDVFAFLNQTHLSFPEGDNNLLLEILRSNAKCPNCRQTVHSCNDGKVVTGTEGPDVLRVGLVVAKHMPGLTSVSSCGFPCANEFLFPVPDTIGQATVTSLFNGNASCVNFPQLHQGTAPSQAFFGGPPQIAGAPNRKAFFFGLKCTGHDKTVMESLHYSGSDYVLLLSMKYCRLTNRG